MNNCQFSPITIKTLQPFVASPVICCSPFILNRPRLSSSNCCQYKKKAWNPLPRLRLRQGLRLPIPCHAWTPERLNPPVVNRETSSQTRPGVTSNQKIASNGCQLSSGSNTKCYVSTNWRLPFRHAEHKTLLGNLRSSTELYCCLFPGHGPHHSADVPWPLLHDL
jgi:hypothetical protein